MTDRLKVLLICRGNPSNLRTGSGVRLGRTVKALAAVADVDVVCVTNETLTGNPFEQDGARTIQVPLFARRSRALVYLVACVTRRPRRLAAFRVRRQQASIAHAVGHGYDVIWAYSDTAAEIAPSSVARRVIVDLIDYEVERDLRLARASGTSHRRRVALVAFDAWALRLTIKRIAERCSSLLVCSELDRQRLDRAEVIVLPNSYDAPDIVRSDSSPEAARALFAGMLSYAPNADGIQWFVKDVWPLVLEEVPQASLRIVGRGGEDLALDGDGVTVVGEVPTMREELETATVVVVPIRHGSGTRVKVLEAWSSGIPVVSTTLGVEGLKAVNGLNVLIADSPTDMASAVAKLMADPLACSALAAAALDTFVAGYTFDKFAAQVSSTLQSAS